MSTSTKPESFQMPAPSAEHMATHKVATRLVELCSAGKNMDAIKELYADDVRSIEAMEGPGCPRITAGKPNVIKAAEHFWKITTVHGGTIGSPVVNGDQFILPMSMDCTCSEGPMAGQRMNMSETALYTVKNNKISEARFFYSCGM